MKNITLILLLLLAELNLPAQNTGSHQPQAPPTQPNGFSRGMFVDCSADIISDMYGGNVLGLFQELKQYIHDNYISFIALSGLDHSAVIGNPTLEPTLRVFLSNLRQNFPDLRIAAVGSSEGFFSTSRYLRANDYFSRNCFPGAYGMTLSQADSIINNNAQMRYLKRTELCKFFLRAAGLNRCKNERVSDRCKAAFDVLYLDYPYWKDAGIASLSDMQAEFENYTSILKIMQMLKCNFSCITSVESTFQPTDYYRLLGWTATDQITSADPLIDRMMIPAYSSDPSNGFDISCRKAHLLSDRFTKNGTTFYIGLSAQSANYSYCNSSDIPQNHLGEYLDGSATTSGNMYSVEKNYVDKLNNPSYFCADCSCYSYNDNQYSTTNLPANRCTGSLWYTYTMLRDHSISRQIRNLNPMTIVPDAIGRINVRIKEDELLSSILLYDVSGRIIRKAENINQASFDLITEELSPGIYFLQAITTQNRKFNRSLPVPYR